MFPGYVEPGPLIRVPSSFVLILIRVVRSLVVGSSFDGLVRRISFSFASRSYPALHITESHSSSASLYVALGRRDGERPRTGSMRGAFVEAQSGLGGYVGTSCSQSSSIHLCGFAHWSD